MSLSREPRPFGSSQQWHEWYSCAAVQCIVKKTGLPIVDHSGGLELLRIDLCFFAWQLVRDVRRAYGRAKDESALRPKRQRGRQPVPGLKRFLSALDGEYMATFERELGTSTQRRSRNRKTQESVGPLLRFKETAGQELYKAFEEAKEEDRAIWPVRQDLLDILAPLTPGALRHRVRRGSWSALARRSLHGQNSESP